MKTDLLDIRNCDISYGKTLHGRLMARFTLKELEDKAELACRKDWVSQEEIDVWIRRAQKYKRQ